MNILESKRYFRDPNVAAFVDSVQRGDVAAVKAGLAQGIDSNSPGIEGFRPIHFVFSAKHADALKVLLAAGADPNARLSNGNAPIMFSVRMQDLEFTRALLAAGAVPGTPGANEKPPIHEAIYQPYPAHIGLLAAAGADINVIWARATPVMAALEIAQWQAALILIDHGADTSPKNEFGETALDLACQTLKRVPANDANRQGVAAIVQALGRRQLTLPCESDLAKFK